MERHLSKVTVELQADRDLVQILEAEVSKDAKISFADGIISLRINGKEGDTWADVRARVNTILRVCETAMGVERATRKGLER